MVLWLWLVGVTGVKVDGVSLGEGTRRGEWPSVRGKAVATAADGVG